LFIAPLFSSMLMFWITRTLPRLSDQVVTLTV
jgi:hypothetical protein